jgi:predicted ribosome quality control (RQC) complex YloA/Tae2 family protein
MSFDALTLSAVRDEIEPLLVDGRIQKVAFPDATSLALEVFLPGTGRGVLLLDVHPERGRVQMLQRLPARGIETESPFSLVARKHLRNARIRSVRQPRLERLLELDCEQRDDSSRHYNVLLIVEAMGRRGNLLLVDADGAIMDAVRRTPPSRNPRRPVLPHMRYDLPPAQERLPPERLTPEELSMAARGKAGALATLLVNTLAGISPLASRELAFRATGAVETPVHAADWSRVVEAIAELFAPLDTHAWEPTVAFEGDAPLAYAPYRLRHLAAAGARLQTFASMSAALEAFHAAPRAAGDPLAAERKSLLAVLDRLEDSHRRRAAALEQQLIAGEEQREPLRRAGELILTHQSELSPSATELIADDERVVLDPDLTPVQNAQAYFARYRKAREAAERVPGMLADARQTSEHLAELHALVEVADSMDAVRALRREVSAASGSAFENPQRRTRSSQAATRNQQTAAGPIRRIPIGDGWEVLVGASASGNARVTFDMAGPDDVWLHARGVPGAHVIVRGPSMPEPPMSVLTRAAEVAAWHSASRSAGAVDVDYTARRHVRKVPGGPPGLVRYTNERTLRVQARL